MVTGGASGMGAALVAALPKLGARVVSLDLDQEAGAARAKAAGAAFRQADVTDQAGFAAAVDSGVAELGGLDVLIHAAGIAPSGPAATMTLDLWNQVMGVNATGTFIANQAVYQHLKDNGGAIINFCSAAGINGYPGKAAYAAAKGAVAAWVRSLAVEWAPSGIRINALAPAIWTPMYDRTRSEMSAEQLAAHDTMMKTAVPLGGKLGDVQDDFVPVVVFLASESSRFITGQILPVDGGALMMR